MTSGFGGKKRCVGRVACHEMIQGIISRDACHGGGHQSSMADCKGLLVDDFGSEFCWWMISP